VWTEAPRALRLRFRRWKATRPAGERGRGQTRVEGQPGIAPNVSIAPLLRWTV
jgi:hypothetical protein